MKRITSSSLIRNVLAVASGTAVAQIVVFAFSPLITRIYSPEAFGLQGVFLSLISILSPIVALRYPMAIVTAISECEAAKLARLSFLIAVGMSSLLGLALIAGGRPLLQIVGAEGLGSLIYFLPLALIAVALQDVANFRAARLSAFRIIGAVAVAQAFIVNLARVGGGLASPLASTLVTVTSLAPAVQAIMLRSGVGSMRHPAPRISRTDLADLLKRHRDFPIYRMPTDVLNAGSQVVPVILLASLFSPTAAGLYTLTRSVLNLPSNIIGAAVGNVLYTRFAELSRSGQPLMPLLIRSTMALLALAPAIVGFASFAPAMFSVLFGDEWQEAGYYAQWMALWIAMMVANIPAVRVIPVIRKQHEALIFNIILILARISSIFLAYFISQTPLMAVASYSVCSATLIAISIIHFMIRTSAHDKKERSI
ncbi:O-antigen/teichoic acid export membrane protein [Limimaricola soesokkakensis]|uniref:Colanic acid exporter n=1 Tax=Limimaricola soesokkakensis TaxID=1343159 RepID=A0A1X7A0Z4_9RHOB|nr:oligosaccharide flippase family protein [Limimaricola soesokkakensis]PSK80413.1 O-antigen/teichoic acid export membrane protein [Limimaricola soesokkakensis]SLN66913.1 colanic acid exporter [Limimaricola soesokkakensis]